MKVAALETNNKLFHDIPIILRVVRRLLQWKLNAEYLAFSRYTLMLNSIAHELRFKSSYENLLFLSRSNMAPQLQVLHLPVKVGQGIVKIKPEELGILPDNSG